MPNHVSHKIIIRDIELSLFTDIIEKICSVGMDRDYSSKDDKFIPTVNVDFHKLVPEPIWIYRQNIGKEDEEDFGEFCGLNWSRKNWGTKWNAYSTKIDFDVTKKKDNPDDYRYLFIGDGVIEFDTAWSNPYPWIVAFANSFNIQFEYRYFDEGHNFWGTEQWKKGKRTSKDYKNPDNKRTLSLDLKGHYYNEDEGIEENVDENGVIVSTPIED